MSTVEQPDQPDLESANVAGVLLALLDALAAKDCNRVLIAGVELGRRMERRDPADMTIARQAAAAMDEPVPEHEGRRIGRRHF